jgi:hypothetical protein
VRSDVENSHKAHGVGANPAATHAAMHFPSATLQAIITAGTPAPAVTVPNVDPPAYSRMKKSAD